MYVSNETPNIDVFFDNLQVSHVRGPLLQEDHYYPFGLAMQGISSKSAGAMENKKKFTSQDLDDELGVNLYQMRFRNHDPQIGRFIQIDPLADQYVHNSTYAYAENNVIEGIDLEGLEYISAKQLQQQGLGIINDASFNNRFRSESTNQSYQAKALSAPASVKASGNYTVVKSEPLVSLTVSVGAQVGVKAGPVGGEINFGSKEIGTISEQGLKVGNLNETKKGMELNIGIASVSGQSTSVTNSSTVKTVLGEVVYDKTTTTNTYGASVGIPKIPFLQVGTQREQVYEQYSRDGITTSPVLISDSRQPTASGSYMTPVSSNATKVSITAGIKIELGFRVLDILSKICN